MLRAYLEGKDLYCVIAQSIWHNKYEDNLEFYPEFTEVPVGNTVQIAGNEKEYSLEVNETEKTIILPSCYLVQTSTGKTKSVAELQIGDTIISEQNISLRIRAITIIEGKPEKRKLAFY